MPIIEIKNLSFEYGDNLSIVKPALDDINISVQKGEIIGVVGHTGSGKSTFMQMLNGLLKPSNGSVILDEIDIWKEPKKIRDIRFKVGLAFQYPEHQLFEETVYKDIAFGPRNKGLSDEEIEKSVRDAIKFVDFPSELLEVSPFELSGGEKRRVAIAGIIAMNPEVLILDEPTAGLDPKGKRTLIDNILKYHKEKNNTIFFVSHNMDDIAYIADRILVLDKGKVAMFDVPEKIFKRANELQNLGLEVPEITRIVEMLNANGFEIDESIVSVEKVAEEIVNLIEKRG